MGGAALVSLQLVHWVTELMKVTAPSSVSVSVLCNRWKVCRHLVCVCCYSDWHKDWCSVVSYVAWGMDP